MIRIELREQRTYDHLVRPGAVHGDAYTDPAIFGEEQRQIFGRCWLYVGHESEVPAPGDFKRSMLGLQPVILCRDRHRSVHVLFNRCRHRGALVCVDDAGNADGFRCDYHGWHYRLNGDLAGVPYDDAYTDLKRSTLGLTRPPRVQSYRGFVFASLATEGDDLESYLGPPCLEQIDLVCDLSPEGRVIVQAGTSKLAYEGNWKLQMENTIDGYHPNFAHQSYFAELNRASRQRIDAFDGDSIMRCRVLGNGHTLMDYRPYFGAHKEARLAALRSTSWGRRYCEDLIAAYGRERAETVLVAGGTHMSVFPNMAFVAQHLRTIRPLRHDHTEVMLAAVLLEGVPDEVNIQRIRMHEAFYSPQAGGIHDDLEMFTRVSEGLRCREEPWLDLSRGLHRERRDTDGTVVGHVTDELAQREMWRRWKELMEA